jgi:hypothetical protein
MLFPVYVNGFSVLTIAPVRSAEFVFLLGHTPIMGGFVAVMNFES